MTGTTSWRIGMPAAFTATNSLLRASAPNAMRMPTMYVTATMYAMSVGMKYITSRNRVPRANEADSR
jgi:hypothetical protein